MNSLILQKLMGGALFLTVGLLVAGKPLAEESDYTFDDAWNPKNEEEGIVRLNPDDPTYNLPFEIRDTSKDPKREPGPIYLNRQVFGNPFMGIPTFLRSPVAITPEDLVAGEVDVAFVGLPLDFNSVRRGALLGPQAVRTAEVLLHWHAGGYPLQEHTDVGIDPLSIVNLVDYGDIPVEPFSLERSIGHAIPILRDAAATGTTLLICGGAHSLPYPTIRAMTEVYGAGNVGVIHFDAHQDMQNKGFGHAAHYGTFARSLINEGHVKGEHMIQVGMRGPVNSVDGLRFQREKGVTTFYMAAIRQRGFQAVAQEILSKINEPGFPEHLYISVDLDFYDASAAPGTTAPEHGGVMPVDFFPLLRAMAISKNVVAADIVEVSPMNDDRSGTTMLLASRTFLEIITGIALKKEGVTDPWYLHPDLIVDR